GGRGPASWGASASARRPGPASSISLSTSTAHETHRPCKCRGWAPRAWRGRGLLARDVTHAPHADGGQRAGKRTPVGPQDPLLVRPDVPAAEVQQAGQVALHGHAAPAEVPG